MPTLNNAVASTDVNEVVTTDAVNSVDVTDETLDQYGRMASERTIELSPDDAEAIDAEVTAGEHDTFDDALHYVVTRGFAEIKRARKAAAELALARKVKHEQTIYSEMLKRNPTLVTDPNFVAKMIAALGVKTA